MGYPFDPHVARFTFPESCSAADVDPASVRNWLRAEPGAVLIGKGDRVAVGSGRPILLSFSTIVQIGLTARLVREGLPPRRASVVAAGFAHVGDDERPPGHLFDTPFTVLAKFEGEEIGRVLHMPGDAKMRSLFFPSEGPARSSITTALVVDFTVAHARKVLDV